MSELPQEPTHWTNSLEQWLELANKSLYPLLGIVLVLLALVVLARFRQMLRRRKPPRFHEKLQPYAEGAAALDENLATKRRAEAAKILATSSTTAIAGYDIIEQVEAVFVEGFRRPEEALEGLKAAAAMKGANALTNVHRERSASGKCAATGDAVRVQKRAMINRMGDTKQPPVGIDANEGLTDGTSNSSSNTQNPKS